MVVQRLELEQETEKGVLVLTEELTSLVVAKILKLAIAASQRKNSSPGATKRQLSVFGSDFFCSLEKEPILECVHNEVEQCHYTYVTQFKPSQEEVGLIFKLQSFDREWLCNC